MKGQAAFLGKEFLEIAKTYKIYVIPGLFLLIGLMSPILAKLAPDLVKSVAQGLTIQIPPPVAADAYLQLFKNLNQLGVLAVIFTSTGLVAEEKARGTAALMTVKPLTRTAFIVSKYVATAVLVLGSILLAYLASLYYTVILFREALFAASALALLLASAYYLLISAVTLLASTLCRSSAAAGGLAAGAFIVLSVLPSLHPWLARYTPGALVRYENALLASGANLAPTRAFADAVPALGITLALAGLMVALSVVLFRRQEL